MSTQGGGRWPCCFPAKYGFQCGPGLGEGKHWAYRETTFFLRPGTRKTRELLSSLPQPWSSPFIVFFCPGTEASGGVAFEKGIMLLLGYCKPPPGEMQPSYVGHVYSMFPNAYPVPRAINMEPVIFLQGGPFSCVFMA